MPLFIFWQNIYECTCVFQFGSDNVRQRKEQLCILSVPPCSTQTVRHFPSLLTFCKLIRLND